MAKILRYTIPYQRGTHSITLPSKFVVLSVGVKPRQNKYISIWAAVDEDSPLVEKKFYCFETNEELEAQHMKHRATIVLPSQEYALHVFEDQL